MNIRRSLAAVLLLVAAAAGAPAAAGESAQQGQQSEASPEYREGEHYHRLPVPVDTEDPERIEVTEVFGYACVHCYRFDPILEQWLAGLPGDVVFHRVPAVFNETWEMLARLFYAADALGVGEQMHMPLFQAIHDRGIDLRRPELAEELFWVEARVRPDDFKEALNSFAVFTRLRQADARGRVYRVTGVPSLIVNGKYRIDSGDAGGYVQMLRIAGFLIDLERAAREEPG